MTPEERASKIVDDIAVDADFYCDGRVNSSAAKEAMEYAKSAIVAAIRAAVNDALEQAACNVEQKTGFEELPRLRNIAESIRALKHPTSS